MANFDTSTPQLKVVKKLLDAYVSLDMSNAEPLLSKNFQYQPFPETGLPKEAKGGHIQRIAGILAAVSKFEVCIRHLRTAFKLAN